MKMYSMTIKTKNINTPILTSAIVYGDSPEHAKERAKILFPDIEEISEVKEL
jgi:hypothetical protein